MAAGVAAASRQESRPTLLPEPCHDTDDELSLHANDAPASPITAQREPIRAALPMAVVLCIVCAALAGWLGFRGQVEQLSAVHTQWVQVARHYNFSKPGEAISYGYRICEKVSRGEGYAQVMGDVKSDVIPNDEFAANYLVSYAVNLVCPAQIWQLRNSAAHYQPPADENAFTAPIPSQRRY
jgi:hypothetical protein